MKKFITIAITHLLLFSLNLASHAQGTPQLNVIGRITSSDGLLTGGIKYTIKDSDGFMWFSYSVGFNRWNGYDAFNIENFLVDTNVISSYRYCRPMIEDKNGYLYVGTLRNGLVRVNRATNEYRYYVNDPGNPNSIRSNGIHEMIMDEEGIIWLGTFVFGLSRFDPVKETFSNYIVDSSVSYPWDYNNIKSLCIDSEKIFWVGTSNGLFQFVEEDATYIPVNIPIYNAEFANIFESILEDANKDMWFGTNCGIFKYSRATQRWDYIDLSNKDKTLPGEDYSIYKMVEYKKHNKHYLWMGTRAGLKVYDIKNRILTHCTPKNGYPEITNAGIVQYLFIDEQDILWASLAGITLFDLNDIPFHIRFINSYPDSLNEIQATCFYEDKSRHIWVGTDFDGLFQFDGNLNFIANYKPCAGSFEPTGQNCLNEIKDIYEDREGRLWVNTGPTGLSLFDIETGTFHFMDVDVGSYLPGQLLQDSWGVIWMCAYDGLFKCTMAGDKELDIELCDYPTLPKVPVDEVLFDSQNRLWLITRVSGVLCLTPENRDQMIFKPYLHQGYKHRFTMEYNARSVIEDDWGDIWFRSERGLFKYDPELDSIVPDANFNKHYQGYIFSITRDKNGVFWFAIDNGLLRYDPEDNHNGGLRVIDYRNGLPFSFITRSTLFRDSRGYLYGGGRETTRRGLFRFHPDNIPPPNKAIPKVYLTRFPVKNEPFPVDSNMAYKKHLVLDHNQNFFSFEFSALNYVDPVKNEYAYKLEGLDEDWVYSGNRHFANYTGVPPGHYVFRVKGSNNDGYWNEEGTSIAVTILKPPWRSWWANVLYFIFIAGVIASIAWYYLKRQQLRRELLVEQMQKEKLEEMDRLKSRFFANISHEFRTPLTLILGPIKKLKAISTHAEMLEDLNIMQRNAGRLQRLIDQLLSLSKIEAGQMKLQAGKGDIVEFVRGYLGSFESAAENKGIKINFNTNLPTIPLYFDRDKLEKIFYNLFANAIKFSGEGGLIQVNITGHDSSLTITISDTGRGIQPEHLPYIFDRFYQADNFDTRFHEGSGIGLSLVKELVELHRGQITVESKPGKGTTFTISLPAGSNHLKEEELSEITEIPASAVSEEKSIEISAPDPELAKHPEECAGNRKKPLLLVVEDNADMRKYIRSIIEGPYLLAEADNGSKGLEWAIEQIPDLVISDVMMPGLDGYELCRQLKSDYRTSHIPLILLTAKASSGDKIEGLQTGADDFLIKPFEPMELLARIKNLIIQRQALRERYRKEFEHVKLKPEASMDVFEVEFMEKARKVVGENISNFDFHITEFSNLMNMSRVQLHRKLNALFNLSATAFVRTYRLNEAARLFNSRMGNVAEVAYEVGFNNLSYFTKCFQQQFGMNPSEYLNQLQQPPEKEKPR
jgi:signal transduction histidine kinase/DNA-binding response OmpR family regulator/ligand-binding sensor domain-containing protein